jgi:hypothetical protein
MQNTHSTRTSHVSLTESFPWNTGPLLGLVLVVWPVWLLVVRLGYVVSANLTTVNDLEH